jgi:hypothetical protein
MEKLTGNTVEGVVVDTMGIKGRKKSILASYHGRYHTIGMADLRAVSTDMSPLYSGGFRSTDSEAMNKIGKLLLEEPTLGRVMASKKHIYVDGLNVRRILEDFGHLILYNVRKSIFPIPEICESVERSNHLKKKVRILEGCKARVEKHNAGLSLIAAELVISVAGLYHVLNGWSGPESTPAGFKVRWISDIISSSPPAT